MGTFTVKLVVLADITMACTAPKYTTLLTVVELKLVPVTVIAVPATAETGLIPMITGTGAGGIGEVTVNVALRLLVEP
jgi:hypothetical protein